jgi:hypothetical protein
MTRAQFAINAPFPAKTIGKGHLMPGGGQEQTKSVATSFPHDLQRNFPCLGEEIRKRGILRVIRAQFLNICPLYHKNNWEWSSDARMRSRTNKIGCYIVFQL